jgi:hypothetical protein
VTIKFADASKFDKGEPQQLEAWEYLQQHVDPKTLETFAEIFRRVPPGPPKLTPASPFSLNVTPHFTYGELTLNQEARRFTNQGQCDIAIELCEFLERARNKFGPLKITSGHRPVKVNNAVGGASNSEHLYKPGCGAVDVYPINTSCLEFEKWCDKEWPYSVGYGASYRGFVHIGIRTGRQRIRWNY